MSPEIDQLQSKLYQLSAQNRESDSAEIEAALVTLRHDLAKAVMASPSIIKPLESAPDLFLGANTLPEIHSSELTTDTLRSAILNHGALLVRNLFSDAQVSKFLELSQRPTLPFGNQLDRLNLGCSPHILFELLETYRDCGLLGVIDQYLNNEAMIFAERAKLRHHRSHIDQFASIPWHQDVNFFGTKSYGINCWAAISSCGEHNPGLAIIPRRTEQRHGWNGEELAPLDYGKSLPDGMIADLTRDYPIATPVLAPGDALLFDEMTIHQTHSRPWKEKEQIVTISWFFAASRFPNWGTPLAACL